MKNHAEITFIGTVKSPLKETDACPKQGFEGAPDAILEIKPAFISGVENITLNTNLVVLTWLHQADRKKLKTHPKGDKDIPEKGVFLTRSPHRPNPIGIHEVRVVEVESPSRIIISPLEVIDGTPIVDIKVSLCKESNT